MNVHLPDMMVFESTGLSDEVTQDLIFKERGGAIINLFNQLDHEYCKKECPYELFNECKTVK
jgi:SulP family sulfate permease